MSAITSPFVAFYKDDNHSGYMHLRGTHVVYIIEFMGGIVKVGQTADFETRIGHHMSGKRTRGRALVRWWAVKSTRPLEDERFLLHLARSMGGTAWMGGSEWFENVDALELIGAASLAHGLGPFDPDNPMPHRHEHQPAASTETDAPWELTAESLLDSMREMATRFQQMHSGDRLPVDVKEIAA